MGFEDQVINPHEQHFQQNLESQRTFDRWFPQNLWFPLVMRPKILIIGRCSISNFQIISDIHWLCHHRWWRITLCVIAKTFNHSECSIDGLLKIFSFPWLSLLLERITLWVITKTFNHGECSIDLFPIIFVGKSSLQLPRITLCVLRNIESQQISIAIYRKISSQFFVD
jgi:hypothetical protein